MVIFLICVTGQINIYIKKSMLLLINLNRVWKG